MIRDRDDDLERAIRSILDLIFLRQFGLCVPVAVPQRSMIAPPISVLRPKQEPGVGGPYRHDANGKYRQYCRTDSYIAADIQLSRLAEVSTLSFPRISGAGVARPAPKGKQA